MYTLATSFHLPPTAISTLTQCIRTYQLALTRTTSILLQLDARYNLAQAQIELADMTEDLYPSRRDDVRQLRSEAFALLGNVMEGQLEYLRSGSISDSHSLEEDDVEVGEEPPGDVSMNEADGGGVEESTVYETHLPTPSSVIDTILLLIDLELTLWTAQEPLSPPPDSEQQVVQNLLQQMRQITSRGRQAEADLMEIKYLVALDEIVMDGQRSSATLESGYETSLDGAIAVLQALYKNLDVQPPDEPTVRADILTTLADIQFTAAKRRLDLGTRFGSAANDRVRQAWELLSATGDTLTTAFNLPTSPSTPKLHKPSTHLSLSQVNFFRTRVSTSNDPDIAMRNCAQLVDNALILGFAAARSLGWNWIEPQTPIRPGPLDMPYPSGWDAELLARNVVLHILRICGASTLWTVSETLKERCTTISKGIMTGLKKLTGERRLSKSDVVRFVKDIEDEEGGLLPEESQYWESLARDLGD